MFGVGVQFGVGEDVVVIDCVVVQFDMDVVMVWLIICEMGIVDIVYIQCGCQL